MTLFDPSGAAVSTVIDEPAQITTTLSTSGQYLVEVRLSSSSDSTGYNMSLTCNTPSTGCNYTSALSVGASVSGQLGAADAACGSSKAYAKAYKLPVVAGDAFEVQYSASYPVSIEIDGPDGSGVFRVSDGNSLTTAFLAPASGNATIWVSSNTTTPVAGSFSMTLTPITLPTCGRARVVRH